MQYLSLCLILFTISYLNFEFLTIYRDRPVQNCLHIDKKYLIFNYLCCSAFHPFVSGKTGDSATDPLCSNSIDAKLQTDEIIHSIQFPVSRQVN